MRGRRSDRSIPAEATAAVAVVPIRRTAYATTDPPAPGDEAHGDFERLTALTAQLLDVPTALVTLVEGDEQRVLAATGLAAPITGTSLHRSLCAEVMDRDTPLVIADTHDPAFAPNGELRDRVRAYLGYPLREASCNVLGSFCAIDTVPHDWSDRDVEVVRTMAEAVCGELAMQELAHQERTARQEVERQTGRLRFMAEASRRLSGSLDERTVLGTGARLTVPDLADVCTVDLVDGRGLLRRSSVAQDEQDPQDAEALLGLPVPDGAESGLYRVARTGRTALLDDMEDARLATLVGPAPHRDALRALGLRSAAMVPMVSRQGVVGVLSLYSREPARHRPEEVPFLEDLGARIALAVDNARLYQRAEETVEALQASLLPARLPTVPHLALGAAYRAAGGGSKVGGDFYDVFAWGDRWLVVLGDVCGKGPRAAALAGLVRQAIRGAAVSTHSPAAVLGVVNDVLLAEGATAEAEGDSSDDVFATVVCAQVEPRPDGTRVTLANAGHPSVLLRATDGSTRDLDATGIPVGLLAGWQIDEHHLELATGETLVLYTDGLVEARSSQGTFLGDAWLRERVSEVGAERCVELARGLVQEAVAFQSGQQRDDAAVLAVRALGR